uniref:Ovule protein n=1 Tax=Panagrellus redivivus TaxID=6233 RepID=A0A7E4UN38_PANRE
MSMTTEVFLLASAHLKPSKQATKTKKHQLSVLIVFCFKGATTLTKLTRPHSNGARVQHSIMPVIEYSKPLALEWIMMIALGTVILCALLFVLIKRGLVFF